MNKYICHYDNAGDEDALCEGNSIFDFKDGFWINNNGELTQRSDAKYWIPPSRIYFIEKQVLEDEK